MKLLDSKVKKILGCILATFMMIGYYIVYLEPRFEFSDKYYAPLKGDIELLTSESDVLNYKLGRMDREIKLRKERAWNETMNRMLNKLPPKQSKWNGLTIEEEVALEFLDELEKFKSFARDQKSSVEYIVYHINHGTGYGRSVENLKSRTLELAEKHLELIGYITKVSTNSIGDFNKYDPLVVKNFIEQEKDLMRQIEMSIITGGSETVKGNDTLEEWKEKNKDLLLKAVACEIHLNSLAGRQDFWKAQGGYKPEWIEKIDGVSDDLINKVSADKQQNLETVAYQNKLIKALIGHKARLDAYKKMTLIDYVDQYGVIYGDLYLPTNQEYEIISSGKYRFK